MKLLRIFLAGFLIANSALAWGQASRQVVTLDRIVAVVNDEVITRLELDSRLNFAARQLARQGTPPPPKEVLERQLLERLVNDRVQVQFARETGLRVDEAELDRAIQRIASDSKLTLDQLRQALERDGVPFQKFREDIRTEIVVARLREREVDNKITVTDGEIDNFIASQEARQGRRDEFDISHILIRVPESASPEQINERRTRAEQALSQLRNGADFRQVAAAFSDAPDALSGGAMGWREENRLPTIFIDTVRSLRVGEVSEILRSPNGFHLVRLNNKRGSQTPVIVQQTNARHILIRTNELVSESEARARLVGLKERLENKADFAALAQANSEDSSAAKGGDLGWLSPGDTVPEFERAMNALQPGQISEPIKSPFGWHLIQVIARRNEDMSKERQRLEARQALRARKSDEEYQEWVRQLRDRAYVELRLGEG
jgi:peptidyl-prolyl cis-trans isomerase SurA